MAARPVWESHAEVGSDASERGLGPRNPPGGGIGRGAKPPSEGIWRWGKWAIPLAVVPLLILLAYGFRTDPRAIPSPLVGRAAAPFSITLFSGGSLSLDELKGKVVVVNFWASWCYPACYEEAPGLERGWRAYRDRGVVVVGVDIQDTEEAARKFMRQFSLTFPNGPDPAGRISVDYGVYGVPETFFIDRSGRIRKKHVGAVTEAVFTGEVERLLKEPS
ncbi:MAG: TlpA family protein disulfide reductase [Candidatus Rokubacteria bacterium]|nr:TlpA family protein disulfide reductase [Candidatus Rokubacteria bacterium]